MTPPGLQFPVSPVDVRVPWLASRLLCVGNREGENKVMSSESKQSMFMGPSTTEILSFLEGHPASLTFYRNAMGLEYTLQLGGEFSVLIEPPFDLL